ncbi:hypothetical protein [Vulcanisaeta thermophila]|nr:hypothetical protein [Vulcanisaeta thermophila]
MVFTELNDNIKAAAKAIMRGTEAGMSRPVLDKVPRKWLPGVTHD